jgi:hypothetical protein
MKSTITRGVTNSEWNNGIYFVGCTLKVHRSRKEVTFRNCTMPHSWEHGEDKSSLYTVSRIIYNMWTYGSVAQTMVSAWRESNERGCCISNFEEKRSLFNIHVLSFGVTELADYLCAWLCDRNRVAQSVQCLTTDWTTRVRSLAGAKNFSCSLLCSHRLWGQPSLLYNGYRGSFHWGKARPGRDADHTPPSSAEVKNE